MELYNIVMFKFGRDSSIKCVLSILHETSTHYAVFSNVGLGYLCLACNWYIDMI